jgi:hypothetical protein
MPFSGIYSWRGLDKTNMKINGHIKTNIEMYVYYWDIQNSTHKINWK